MIKRTLSITVIICFFLTTLSPYPQAYAGSVLGLPLPGAMINLSPAFEPVIIKGLTIHKDNPFLFDFIVDIGQDKMTGEPLKKEGEKLIKYFLAGLTIPEKDLWVNLSPYEKNRMVPEALGQTDLGRDLLAQDYILKQLTASLIYPEKQLGKVFWNRVYSKIQQLYGTTQVPVNTFNKVWIMADKAEVFENNQTVFVVNCHLKVMLEEDYLSLQKHAGIGIVSNKTTAHNLGSQVVREMVLPELEKEVNTGKNFANLRQIFNSIILASWYKKNLKNALLNQVYANRSKVKGIDLKDLKVKEQIYEQYLKAYKKGVFNYIKEEVNTAGMAIPHKYFSGGTVPGKASDPDLITRAMASEVLRATHLNGEVIIDAGVTTEAMQEEGKASSVNEKGNIPDVGSRLSVEAELYMSDMGGAWSTASRSDQEPYVDLISGQLLYMPRYHTEAERAAENGIWTYAMAASPLILYSTRLIGHRTKVTTVGRRPQRLQVRNDHTKAPWVQGGIDLNTSNNTQWKDNKNGQGVQIDITPAMIARVKREGINSLSLVIYWISPLVSIWPLVGFKASLI
ncbi:MAG: hypothetical protein HQL13_04135 [Candidatus Omnitrophica bacterium]|nr:hypothetical protein [Candidatus Omnitrophota bacterium]